MFDKLYLGIDFGTSTILVTRWDLSKKKVEPVVGITMQHGGTTYFDNIIYYESLNNYVLGPVAQRRGAQDVLNVVEGIKRKLELNNWKIRIPAIDQELSAEDIVSDIFRIIKKRCKEIYGGNDIEGVVISVPFAFLSNERKKIINAAKKAGLNVLKLIEEPVAAAISYGLLSERDEPNDAENILVFDFGGGTFDVTIFELSSGFDNKIRIEVLNTGGLKNFGGKDIDNMLLKKFEENLGLDCAQIPNKIEREKNIFELLCTAKETKENLSMYPEDDVFCANLYNGHNLEMEISQEDFNNWLLMNDGFMDKLKEVLEETLLDIEMEPGSIDRIVLVGGSSKIPPVEKLIKDLFGKKPESVNQPMEIVGRGAGIYCGSLIEDGFNCDIITKLSHSIGIRAGQKFTPLLEKNSLYESFSDIQYFGMQRKSQNTRIEVFQGNSTDINECSLVGQIDASDFDHERVGVQLGTDNNGIVIYKLFKEGKAEPFKEGFVEN